MKTLDWLRPPDFFDRPLRTPKGVRIWPSDRAMHSITKPGQQLFSAIWHLALLGVMVFLFTRSFSRWDWFLLVLLGFFAIHFYVFAYRSYLRGGRFSHPHQVRRICEAKGLLCPSCGYEVGLQRVDRCPECGDAFIVDEVRLAWAPYVMYKTPIDVDIDWVPKDWFRCRDSRIREAREYRKLERGW